MSLALKVNQQVTARFSEVDVKGAPVPVAGSVSWSTDNTAVLSVSPSTDGKSAVVIALAAGSAKVLASADGFSASADLDVIDVPVAASIAFDTVVTPAPTPVAAAPTTPTL